MSYATHLQSLAAANAVERTDRLPFPALPVQIDNTNGQFLTTVERFGEFAADTKLAPPASWVDSSVRLGGMPTKVLATPMMVLAMIGRRSAWESEDRKLYRPINIRYDALPAGVRWVSRTHALGILAEYQGNVWRPWAPIVLSVRSTQSGYFNKALQAWDRGTKEGRAALAVELAQAGQWNDPKVALPVEAFYRTIGFGESVKVGHGAQSAMIAQLVATLPAPATAEHLRKILLDEATIERCWDLHEQAAEWLNAWSPTNLVGGSDAGGNGHSDADEVLAPEPMTTSTPVVAAYDPRA